MSIPSILAAVAATTALFAGVAAPARAAAFAPPSITVSYADLDMATAAGQDRLDSRIRHAAGTICGLDGRSLSEQIAGRTCRSVAVADARAQLVDVVAGRSSAGGSLVVAVR